MALKPEISSTLALAHSAGKASLSSIDDIVKVIVVNDAIRPAGADVDVAGADARILSELHDQMGVRAFLRVAANVRAVRRNQAAHVIVDGDQMQGRSIAQLAHGNG